MDKNIICFAYFTLVRSHFSAIDVVSDVQAQAKFTLSESPLNMRGFVKSRRSQKYTLAIYSNFFITAFPIKSIYTIH